MQHALHEAGAASLREYLGRAVLDNLPLPPWIMPTSAGDASGPIALPPAPPLKRFDFELVEVHELPSWYTPYPFVRTGYRLNFTYPLSIASLFRLHNGV